MVLTTTTWLLQTKCRQDHDSVIQFVPKESIDGLKTFETHMFYCSPDIYLPSPTAEYIQMDVTISTGENILPTVKFYFYVKHKNTRIQFVPVCRYSEISYKYHVFIEKVSMKFTTLDDEPVLNFEKIDFHPFIIPITFDTNINEF